MADVTLCKAPKKTLLLCPHCGKMVLAAREESDAKFLVLVLDCPKCVQSGDKEELYDALVEFKIEKA